MRKKKSPSSKIPKGQRKIKEVLVLSNKKDFDPLPYTDDEDVSGVASKYKHITVLWGPIMGIYYSEIRSVLCLHYISTIIPFLCVLNFT